LPISSLRPGVGGVDDAKDGMLAALALGFDEEEVGPVDEWTCTVGLFAI
jgi:hypothetical protein